jgi:hypothetical protein
MSKNLQIRVPQPCGENWDDMSPSAGGRHCSSCLKTVVDFTLMSDQEVLFWLTNANRKVCGRFSADQLDRNLLPAPERKRSVWNIWNFILAGLLVSSKVPAQTKVIVTPVSQHDKRLLGEPLAVVKIPVQADTPKYTVLPPVVVTAYGQSRRTVYDQSRRTVLMGAVSTVRVITLTDLLKDTLTFIGFPKKELTLYPNPASRGTAVRLSCPPDLLGECKLELFNSNGALLQERSVEWRDKSQTESLNLPASLSAGVYFVKMSPAGTGKVVTRKLVVL